jgi:hypothetical protein
MIKSDEEWVVWDQMIAAVRTRCFSCGECVEELDWRVKIGFNDEGLDYWYLECGKKKIKIINKYGDSLRKSSKRFSPYLQENKKANYITTKSIDREEKRVEIKSHEDAKLWIKRQEQRLNEQEKMWKLKMEELCRKKLTIEGWQEEIKSTVARSRLIEIANNLKMKLIWKTPFPFLVLERIKEKLKEIENEIYQVKERLKSIDSVRGSLSLCPFCGGQGRIIKGYVRDEGPPTPYSKKCPICGGSGKITD